MASKIKVYINVNKQCKICDSCKLDLPLNSFISTKNGKTLKKCLVCQKQCEHGNKRSHCYECSGNLGIAKVMYACSIASDRKSSSRLEGEGYLTVEYIFDLLNKITKCPQCGVDFQYVNRKQNDGVTIQRLDNSITHTNINCTLLCWKCNNVDGHYWRSKNPKPKKPKKTPEEKRQYQREWYQRNKK